MKFQQRNRELAALLDQHAKANAQLASQLEELVSNLQSSFFNIADEDFFFFPGSITNED